MRRPIRIPASPGLPRCCSSATRPGHSASAGPSARWRRARCAGAASEKAREKKSTAAPNETVEAIAHVEEGEEKEKFATRSFGAVFCEVRVDEDLGRIRVPRIVADFSVGRLMNLKLARSQLIGGLVWGVSMALMEESQLDLRYGRFVNANLAEYPVPV